MRKAWGAFLVGLVGTASVSAAVLVHDPFSDGNRSNTSGGDPLGAVYYRSTTSAGATLAVSDDTSGIGAGNALLFTPNADSQKYVANFTPATLVNAGDYIRMTFDFRFTVTPPSVGDGFRLGLFSSNATRQSSDGGGTIRNDDKGYVVAFNATTTTFSIRKEDANGSDDILGGTVYFTNLSTSTAGSMVACGTTKHTLSLVITRVASGDLQFRAQFDNLTAATGTLAAASVLTYTLDEFAIGFGTGGAWRPFFLDNLHIVRNAIGAVALTAPAADTVVNSPASIVLSATATDPDGMARVDFYDGATKIGEAASAPYAFTWTGAGPGVHSLTAVAIDSDGEGTSSSPVDIRVTGGAPDEFDTLRGRWLAQLTGGTSYNTSDPDIANRITAITSSAQSQWNTLLKTGGNSRAYLWSDAASSTISAHISTCYSRLRTMALAYGTTGSTLQGNASLLADIAGGLDWMNANRYNENVTPYDNWYDWEIGASQSLNDIVVLLYDQLPATRLMNQMRAIERFDPTAETFTFSNSYNTGANRTDKDCVVAVRGAIVKDSAKLFAARDSLSPVFSYVTGGDGFYTDGSFVQHTAHPYNGGYGADLIDSLGPTLAMLNGSTWAVSDPKLANLYRWIYDSYDPFIFRGAMMDCVRGRDMSRSGDEEHARGQSIITSILRIADFAPAADALAYKRMARAWITADTARNFLTNNPLPAVLRAKAVLADASITPRPELVTHRHFAGMDRVVHWRPGFAFAVSMSSARIYNYESINSENLHGWYQGDGATYLYDSDIDAYSSAYWPTVNSYRFAGITVDTQARADAASQSTASSKSWVGGAEILGLYGSAGFELAASASTLTARKSWFMFDDEIVALGSGITSTDNRTIETIVENRRLKIATSALTVDGVAKSTALGWSETMSGVGWAHLAATGGYVFPGGATLKGLREARTGQWHDINSGGSTSTNTNNYATMWFDHGSNPAGAGYAWILLPNKTATETSSYAASPDVVILENTAAAHAVREKKLNLTAAHFWEDTAHTAGIITSDRKSAVLARETAAQLDVAVSDPTQLNTGTITVTLARAASGVVSADPGINVLQLTPTIRFTASVSGTYGRALKATFALPLAAVAVTATTPDALEAGSVPGVFTLARSGAGTAELAVPYAVGGTALPATDYAALPGSVLFAEGETTKTVSVVPVADNVPEGDETVTLTLMAGAGYTLGAATAQVTIHDPPLDAWKHQYFAADLSLAGATLDPDHDGLKNLIEYAIGADPTSPTRPDFVIGRNGFLSLTYTRSKAATDVNFLIEVSPDLASWSIATVTSEILSETGTTQRVRATETTPLAPNGKRFIRLRIDQP